jgi:hypothetical protein
LTHILRIRERVSDLERKDLKTGEKRKKNV